MPTIIIRTFRASTLVSSEIISLPDVSDWEAHLPALGQLHAEEMLAGQITMVEFEFVEEPDPLQKFLRFAVNPDELVAPIRVT